MSQQVESTPAVSIDPNAAPIKHEAEGVIRTKAVMSLIRHDGGLLAVKVHSRRSGGLVWTLPGAVTRPGESEEDCLERGLFECVGSRAGARVKVYEGPNTIVYCTSISGEVRGGKLISAWLTDAQFMANNEQEKLFLAVFAAARTHAMADSTVISKLQDGRVLFAIAHEVFIPSLDGGQWELREPHHVHAMNAASAKLQFMQTIGPKAIVRVIGVAPAIGWRENEDGSLEG